MGGGTPPLHFAKISLFLVGATFRRPLITESKCSLLTERAAGKSCGFFVASVCVMRIVHTHRNSEHITFILSSLNRRACRELPICYCSTYLISPFKYFPLGYFDYSRIYAGFQCKKYGRKASSQLRSHTPTER